MNPNLISPFLASTKSVFDTMLNLPVTFGDPVIADRLPSKFDISGIIGMAGDVVGVVVVSFSHEAALQIVQAFTGMPLEVESDDFADAVGEIANMISGAAKAKFEGRRVNISCPTVVRGSNHTLSQPSDATSISIPCHTSAGEFAVEICVKESIQEESVSKTTGTETVQASTAG